MKKNYVKSPLNYIGGKYKLLSQIEPIFPKNINKFVDLFGGGLNVGINVKADKIIYNDIINHLIDLFKEFKENSLEDILNHIEDRIDEYELSKENEFGYKKFRKYYNITKRSLDLYVLICYSFNYQIRFNNSHEFNNPFGRNRSSFSPALKKKLIRFINALDKKNIEFSNKDFNKFDISNLSENDFVYCDPPYLITTGSYNDGKRGFKGWSEKEEVQLLNLLDKLDENKIRFALSNVLEHKGRVNDLLLKWSDKYFIHELNSDYSNCNYQTKNKSIAGSREVLITNYRTTSNNKNNVIESSQLKINII